MNKIKTKLETRLVNPSSGFGYGFVFENKLYNMEIHLGKLQTARSLVLKNTELFVKSA
jgi:hypothetical protein